MDLLWIIVGVVALLVVVLVVRAAIRSMNPKVPAPAAPTTAIPVIRTSPQALSAQTTAQIDALVAAEQRIAAIKVLRDATGVSLQQAKDRIDRWVPHAGAGLPSPASRLPLDASSVRGTLPSTVAAEVDRLVAADQKITAIKLIREHTGLGLKESKDLVEAWTSDHGL